MIIITIRSGSEANGYLIDSNGETLLIECGVKAKEMLNAVGYSTANISGCILSHEHHDHSGYVKQYSKYGFPILASQEVSGRIRDIYGVQVKSMKRMKRTAAGNFSIVPFKVPHNETECDGFLISHMNFGKLLFMTDLEMCTYDMSGQNINHLMIECNYSEKYVNMDAPNKDHIFRGHMELETCKRFIRSIYKPSLQSVGLIHLSNANADADEFKLEIETEFPGVFVWVAHNESTVLLPDTEVR